MPWWWTVLAWLFGVGLIVGALAEIAPDTLDDNRSVAILFWPVLLPLVATFGVAAWLGGKCAAFAKSRMEASK
jgi:quinol-cytochrome oxidoreductase complex cytochrome b subunit